jgi:hypothetical protein
MMAMRSRQLAAFILGVCGAVLLLAAGCSLPIGSGISHGGIELPGNPLAPRQRIPATGGVPGIPNLGGATSAPVVQLGRLVLAIRWPEREIPGATYHVAAIPPVTKSIAIVVRQGTNLVASQVLVRPPQGGVSTASFDLDQMSNLTVEAMAFREQSPNLTISFPIARGTATGVNLQPSLTTRISIRMDAIGAPDITTLTPFAGPPGTAIRIEGTAFGTESAPIVTFNGVTATDIVRESPTVVTCKVPAGATVGPVVMTVAGIESISNAIFWAMTGLMADTPKAPWDPTPSDTRALLLGRTLQLAASASFEIKAGETLQTHGTPPVAVWKSSATDVVSVSQTGLAAATNSVGVADLIAELGGFKTNPIRVSVLTVTVEVKPSAIALPAPDTMFGSFAGLNTFSNGAVTSGVIFSSGDPASVSIDSVGNVALLDPWSSGSILITGVSPADPQILATASVLTRADRPGFVVATLAGGRPGTADGTGSAAQFSLPTAIALDGLGNLFVAEQGLSRIRKVSRSTGAVSWYAGTGNFGPGDGPRLDAQFRLIRGLAADATGNVFVAEDHEIRRIDAMSGSVTTLAGNGLYGWTDGQGGDAKFSTPSGMQVNASGEIFVADRYNHLIRKVDPSGRVTTYAGTHSVDAFSSPIGGYADGPAAAAKFKEPLDLALSPSGDLYIVEAAALRIRKIASDGTVSTIAGGASPGLADGTGSAARFMKISGITFDPLSGNLYVTDGDRIRRVTPAGVVLTATGKDAGFVDGPGLKARLRILRGLAADSGGVVYVADTLNSAIRKIR